MAVNIDAKTEKLFDACKKIINGENELYQSVDLSDQEIVVASFQNLKEEHVNKIIHTPLSYTLEFDYAKSKSILWDLLFLRKFILENCDSKSKVELQKELDKKINSTPSDADYVNVVIKNSALTLEQEKVLTEAIILFQKLRDCLSHGSFLTDDDCFNINSTHPNNYLICNIPQKYLQHFGFGITPFRKDKNIASSIDSFVSYLEVNFNDVNLSYRIHPATLNMLLKLTGDNDEWKKLPSKVLGCNERRLKYLLKLVDNDFEKLKDLPQFLFRIRYEQIDRVLKAVDGDIDKLLLLPPTLISYDRKRITRIFEMLIDAPTEISQIPLTFFNCSDKMFDFYLNLVDGDIKKLKLLPSKLYFNNFVRIKYLYENLGLSIEEISNLDSFFLSCSNTNFAMYLRLVNYDCHKLNNLSFFAKFKNFTEKEILTVLELVDNNYQVLKTMPSVQKDKFILVLKTLRKRNIPINSLGELPPQIFNSNLECLEYLLSLVHNDIERLKQIPVGAFLSSKKKLDYLLFKVNGDVNKLDLFVITNSKVKDKNIIFSDLCDIKKLDYLLNLFNGDYTKLSELPSIVLSKMCSINRLDYLIKQIVEELGYLDLNLFFQFTPSVYTCTKERLKAIISRCSSIKDLAFIQYSLFNTSISLENIDLILEKTKDSHGNTDFSVFKDISWTILNTSKSRIKLILELIDNDVYRLKRVPKELYLCKSDDMVEGIYKQYCENMIKSIFGISEEKVIALIVYMGSIFRNIPINEVSYDNISISKCGIDGFNLKSTTPTFSQQQAVMSKTLDNGKFLTITKEQELLNKYSISNLNVSSKNVFRNCLRIQNEELYRVLRNCSEHLKIYPVGEDKVKLIDGSFEAIFGINELFQLIEQFMQCTLGNKETMNYQDELSYRMTLFSDSSMSDEKLKDENNRVSLYEAQFDEYLKSFSDTTRKENIKNLFVNSHKGLYGKICRENGVAYLVTVVHSKINYLEQQGYKVLSMSVDEDDSLIVSIEKENQIITEKLSNLVPYGATSAVEQIPGLNIKYK